MYADNKASGLIFIKLRPADSGLLTRNVVRCASNINPTQESGDKVVTCTMFNVVRLQARDRLYMVEGYAMHYSARVIKTDPDATYWGIIWIGS